MKDNRVRAGELALDTYFSLPVFNLHIVGVMPHLHEIQLANYSGG